jgi:teichuronic acid biosynthesis glycosyltransferase TuaC
MRILCLTPWFPAQPGAQSGNFILDSLLALKQQGHEITTLVCQPWHPAGAGLLHEDWGRALLQPESHDPALRVSLHRYPSIPRNFWRSLSLWLCKRWLKGAVQNSIAGFRPDVMLVHTEQLAVAATLAAQSTGIPVVVVIHGVNTSPRLNTPAEQRRMQLVLQACDRVVLVGAPLWQPVASLVESTDRFRVVPNGVKLPPLGVAQCPALDRRPLRIISISNLVEGKGVDINLEALARLDKDGLQDWQYTVVGGGSQTGQLKQSALRLGIAHKVHFTGAIPHDDVYTQLVQASVFLLPSWQEAFGVAWLEAMACGLLAIAVEGQGPAAFIRHDVTGLLVPPRNVDSLVNCLRRVFAESDALQLVAQQGQREVRSNYTWSAHAQRLSQVCSEVVAAP